MRAEFLRLEAHFAAGWHLTLAQLQRKLNGFPQCPAVGWINPKEQKVTAAEVRTPILVHELPTGMYGCPNKLKLPGGCSGLSPSPSRVVPVEWSFKARRAVTDSRSWYSWDVESPGRRDCDAQGSGTSFATFNNVRKGQMLRYSSFFAAQCHGTYTITVGFMPEAPPGQLDNGGPGNPGRDGTLLVGRATFTIR
jgi:hypothetical protein